METKKYDDRWSSGIDDKGNGVWIDGKEKKAYGSTFWGGVGPERKDIIVVDTGKKD